jgi:flagellar hook assembly protein FlgD
LVKTISIFNLSFPVPGFDLSEATLIADNGVVNLTYNGMVLGSWDGTNGNGGKVTNGTYVLKVASTSPLGVTTTVTHNVSVQVARSTLDIAVYNEAGEEVKRFTQQELQNLLSGSLLPADYDVGRAKSGPGVITPSYSNPMGNGNFLTITLGSGRSFNWDGKGDNGRILSSGRYFIEIKSDTAGGTLQQIISAITIQDSETSGITGVVLEPNPINVNQLTSPPVFVVNTGMGQVDGVKIKIYTIAGELVQTLVSLPGNPTQVPWSTAPNLSSGTYIAVVELQSNGTRVGRQILKAVVLH